MKKEFVWMLFSFLLATVSFVHAQEHLAAAKTNGKWGFIDKKGNFVIAAQYDKVLSFSDGLAAVNIGYQFDAKNADNCHTGKWGFIDSQGKWVIEPSFEAAEQFDDGLAKVNQGAVYRAYKGVTLMGGKWGFLQKDGTWFIEPNDTLYGNFSEGICSFKIPRGSKWGYINKENKTIIPPIYLKAGEFKQGLAPVMHDDYTFVYINIAGKQAIQSNFKKAYPFSQNRGFVKEISGLPQFINPSGGYEFKIENLKDDENIHLKFSEGLVKIPVKTDAGIRVGYAAKNGAWVAKPVYELGDDFYEGLALVFSDRVYSFINQEGKRVFQIADEIVVNADTKVIFKGIPNPNIGIYSQGLCRVKMGNKWGFIDQKGSITIKAQFEEVFDFSIIK
jgi:hypothetical protein